MIKQKIGVNIIDGFIPITLHVNDSYVKVSLQVTLWQKKYLWDFLYEAYQS